MARENDQLHEIAYRLSNDARELFNVHILDQPPTALEFMRYVAYNRPFVMKNAINHWPALRNWKRNEYLKEQMNNQLVTVSMTPDGWADALKPISKAESDEEMVFTLPYETQLPFNQVLDRFQLKTPGSIHYVQLQNNNMMTQYTPLLKDIETSFGWANDALKRQPEAVNLWIGDQRSKTSLHKDHYENLYAVIRGQKTFKLFPPTDSLFINIGEYPVYQYDDNMNPIPLNYTTKWTTIIPRIVNDVERVPEPIIVHVKEGEVLYLPAMFYHEVEQNEDENGLCVAVNMWYDMEYDQKYCWVQAATSIASL